MIETAIAITAFLITGSGVDLAIRWPCLGSKLAALGIFPAWLGFGLALVLPREELQVQDSGIHRAVGSTSSPVASYVSLGGFGIYIVDFGVFLAQWSSRRSDAQYVAQGDVGTLRTPPPLSSTLGAA